MLIKRPRGCELTEPVIDQLVRMICHSLYKYGRQSQEHLQNGFSQGFIKDLPEILFQMYLEKWVDAMVRRNNDWPGARTWYEPLWQAQYVGFLVERGFIHVR
jgi:hypothetical protein